jgi:hypothetical protein
LVAVAVAVGGLLWVTNVRRAHWIGELVKGCERVAWSWVSQEQLADTLGITFQQVQKEGSIVSLRAGSLI